MIFKTSIFKPSTKEELKVPAKMQYLSAMRDFVVTVGKKHGFAEKELGSFKLALDEAVTNIIRHGYRDTPPGKAFITIRVIVKTNSFTFLIIDQGRTYDPRQAKSPDMAEYIKIGRRGGLGIFMMKKLMDEIDYQVTSEGNELRLVKNFDRRSGRKSILKQITLKNRYAVISSLALTLFVVAGYVLFDEVQSENVKHEILKRVQVVAATMSATSSENLASRFDLTIFENANKLKDDNRDLVEDIYILSQDNRIFASSNRSTLGEYIIPEEHEIVEVQESDNADSLSTDELANILLSNAKVFAYKKQDQDYYDVRMPVFDRNIVSENNVIGYSHVLVKQSSVADQLFTVRILGIALGLAVLLLGYGGIAVLVTRIISPFQGLTEWIRKAGHETISDDIEIDTSNEVGEIAQAFSEMAIKFRKAQIGLVQQKELQKEIQVAQEIQHMLLPTSFPEVEGFDLSTFYQSAKEVGGDLFDFVQVDKDTVGIAVADVSGKGVPGSLVMTMIRTALRLEGRANKNPGDVLRRVNDFVVDDIKKGMFVTMMYLILDSRNRVIKFCERRTQSDDIAPRIYATDLLSQSAWISHWD